MADPDRVILQPDVYSGWHEDPPAFPTPAELGTVAATPSTLALRSETGALAVGPATVDGEAVNRAQMVAADSDAYALNLMGVL